jgi:hypothetical protein
MPLSILAHICPIKDARDMEMMVAQFRTESLKTNRPYILTIHSSHLVG